MTDFSGWGVQHTFIRNQIDVSEARMRYGVAILVPVFALVGIVAGFSDDGQATPVRAMIAAVVLISTLPAAWMVSRIQFGAMWWERGTGAQSASRASALFVLYADVVLAVILFTFVNYEFALYGTVLFAVISVYVAHFVRIMVTVVHIVFTSLVIVILAAAAWRQGAHDLAGILARAMASLVVVSATLLLLRSFSTAMLTSYRTQFAYAHRDPLTGLFNRRGFELWMSISGERGHGGSGVLLIDIDNFKAVNDGWGHDAGDTVLRILSRRLERVVGPEAAVARTGGDEFAIAVRGELETLTQLAEAIRDEVAVTSDVVPVTVSIGVAAFTVGARESRHAGAVIKEALDRADKAMYAAKSNGRNRAVVDSASE